MTRDEIRNDILGLKSNCILAELPTSTGKTRVALDFMNEKQIKGDILIVVPRLVLIDTWKDEFVKWGYEPYLKQVTFTTYISLPKHVDIHFNMVIFDECHHLSERAREAVEYLKSDYFILLSATVTKSLKKEIKLLFPGISCYKISMKEAIDNEILPDPKVYLIPLSLTSGKPDTTFIINQKAKGNAIKISFNDRFRARQNKDTKFEVSCNQLQYYQDMSAMVDFFKRKYMGTNNQIIYFKWQKAAKDRLMWLSSIKNNIALNLLKTLKSKRTLTFCNGIEQTKALGEYCINSENTDSSEYLKLFNSNKIKHITACNMINEGVNLTNCQVGIFVAINSSEIMAIQKIGRILRHKKPIIYILYYKNTREEEIVNEIIKNYNPELITVVNNLKQLNGN